MPSFPDPLPPNTSNAAKLLGVSTPLYFLALSLFAARIYTRIRPVVTLGWDDITISVAMLIGTVHWCLILVSVSYGTGRHIYYVSLTNMSNSMRINFIVQVLWVWSVTLIKISVALMLIRITARKSWSIFLWTLIALLLASGIAVTIVQFIECRPISAFWDPTVSGAECWSPRAIELGLYTTSTLFILADVIFSLLPITFIMKLNRPLREKFILAFLMGLGLFASAAAVVKTILIRRYTTTVDPTWDSIDPGLWGVVEENLGFIAACIPCLKAPFERILKRAGLLSTRGENTKSGTGDSTAHKSYELNRISHTGKQSLGMVQADKRTQSEESILRISGSVSGANGKSIV